MRHTERCASLPVTRKYIVTSHNLPCSVLDIPTNFHQDIDNHLQGGYSYLITNTLQVIIQTEVKPMKRFKLSNSEEILMDTLWRENRPLTTLQLAEKVTEARWNTNYIDKLLGQLVKKAWCRSAVCCRTDAISHGSSSPATPRTNFWRTCSRSKA